MLTLKRNTVCYPLRGPLASVLIILVDGYVLFRYSDAVQEQKLDPAHVRKGREPPSGVTRILYYQRVSTEGKRADAC